MTAEELSALIEAEIGENERLHAILDRIRDGKATLTDSELYAAITAEITARQMRRNVLSLDGREDAFVDITRQRHSDTFTVFSAVQRILDARSGINIRPQKPPFEDGRAHKIGHSLEDRTVPDSTIERRARSATENFCMSHHDGCMRVNAEFRARAGLQSYAIREGGAKCCDWCADVSGKYPANETPAGFWGRHDNCKCSILYETKKGVKQFLQGRAENTRGWEVVAEGAGAEQLVRLTHEQALALQAEHGLTKLGESGRMSMRMAASSQQPPDFSKYDIKRDLSSVESIKQAMSLKLGLSSEQIDLKGIQNTDVLEPFVKRLIKIKDDTGMIFPSIVASDVIDGDPTCIASYKPLERRLYISSRYFNSKEALIDTLKDWASKDILPKQAKSIAYIAEHEAAHIRIPDSLLNTEEAAKIWKRRKLTNDNDYDIYEYYADITAIFRLNKSTSDSSVLKAIEYLVQGGVSM